jgi:hypothetical protein
MSYRSKVYDWTVETILDDIEIKVNDILDMMKSVDEKGFGVLDECIDDLERLSKDLY